MLTRVLKILSKKFKSKNIFIKKQKNCDIRDLSPMIYIINIFFIYFSVFVRKGNNRSTGTDPFLTWRCPP